LLEHDVQVEAGKTVADLSNCGRSIDLVGTGKVNYANFHDFNSFDCASAFFWRKVDLAYGAIEFFTGPKCTSNRATIFLSEWNSGQRCDISRWWLADKITSIRWKSLLDRQTADVSEHPNGSGRRFANIIPWHDKKEISDLSDIDLNKVVSSFMWTAIDPCKEIIHPFKLAINPSGNYRIYRKNASGRNNTTEPQQFHVRVDEKKAQSVTVSTSDRYVQGISASFLVDEDSRSGSVEWDVRVDFSYEHTGQRSITETQTLDLDESQSLHVPPLNTWKAKLLVKVADIPHTKFTTTATRWYDMPISGAVADSTHDGWYKREEEVVVTINGGLAFDTSLYASAQAI
jgi:hypothetical protein